MFTLQADDHVVNPQLLQMALNRLDRYKEAFVPGGAGMGAPGADPAGGAGGGGPPAPPGADAASAGGAGPMAPPTDPGAGSGMPDPMMGILQQILTAVQGGGAAGGAAAGPGGIKPKIDVNVELMQIKNLLAKVVDALGIQVPAQDMVATPDKLTAMSQGQPTTAAPGAAPGGAGGGDTGIQGMAPLSPLGSGPGGGKAGSARTFGSLDETIQRAQALAQVSRLRQIQRGAA